MKQLEARLQELALEFEREMRARGFDPEQAENIAMPSALARLYVERQSVIEKLRDAEDDKSK